MDTNEAMAYLKSMHGESDPQPEETAKPEGATATGEQVVENQETSPAPEPDVDEDRESPKADVTENTAPVEKQTQKKPTRQQQIDHAFMREKKRHRAEIEAKDKRIAELEEKVKKYGALEQGDFDPNDVRSYIDHRFALKGEQDELAQLKTERDRMVNEDLEREATQRHYAQVNECFESDDEREHYWKLLRNGGAKFREFLNEYDDGTIDRFVGDSDVAPLLVSTLMRNPELLKSIVEKRSPERKNYALQSLENRLLFQKRVGKVVAPTGKTQTQKAKPALPIIGSQVTSPGASTESTKRDWNRYLQEHPRGM